ncbi:MAG: ABC transporter permease [Tannerella sp.]|jgi:putative ABC transport system permease protein|nr:ABC transporter permease [Tannerella sp.]
MFLRRLRKSKYLRVVNLLGLSVIFSCLLLSFAYIKKELSYDRFHSSADRIVRFSVQNDNEPVDGRIFGMTKSSPVITDVPAIEDAVFLQYVNTGLIEYAGKSEIINDFYLVTSNFFEVFDFRLLEGDKNTVIDAPGKIAISKKYARRLFGEESPIGKEIKISGRKFSNASNLSLFINGVFEDFPENSHFHTDLVVHLPENDRWWTYVYLLLHPGTDMNELKTSVATKMDEQYKDAPQKISPYIMPLTDIHLYSRVLRELEPNGNINYIYLIAGANLLLLVIVLFNLWLNAGLIFSFNGKYYQLLRLNGASSSVVVKDESLLALVLGLVSILLGGLVSLFVFPQIHLFSVLTITEVFLVVALFLVLVVGVSLFPVITGLSATMFRGFQNEIKPSNFTLDKVKYLLIAQYGIVVFIVILSFGITRQIDRIKTSQVGGHQDSVLVMKEQPNIIVDRYEVLKAELLKHPEIKMVTSAMQLPGSAIRDGIRVRTEDQEEIPRRMPILVVGNDFLPFFNIKPIAGTVFRETRRTLKEEETAFFDMLDGKPVSSITEEYVINRKAVQALGYENPEEAVGKRLYLDGSGNGVDYIKEGTIVGVTEDFNYTTSFEESIPLIVLQRKMFQQCFMIQLSPDKKEQAIQTFNTVWNQINPDYPADYVFLQDIYGQLYYNELNAEMLTRIFSLLCLIIANLGLIIIMAFVIKRKTKEIGIRKVNGATPGDIIRMLNSRFVVWIGVAFVIAVPVSWYVMNYWLQNFAHKTSLDWWIFALSGLLVLLISVTSVSWQSWYAANQDPVKALKTE